jgi:glycosyltransferase involved in cell wall biosynthesis
MVKKDSLYCGLVTDPVVCDACLADNPYNLCGAKNIEYWRTTWEIFLESCDEIRCFSPSSEEILKRAYPALKNLTLRPHRTYPLPALGDRPKKTDTVNIGLIGKLSDIKGRKVVARMLEEAAPESNIRFILLGYAEPPMAAADKKAKANYLETGRYAREDLPKLILEYDIDVIFIASTWPETFSYTTAEAISMGLPVASFDLGGQADQVRKIANGLLLPFSNDDILTVLKQFAKKR